MVMMRNILLNKTTSMIQMKNNKKISFKSLEIAKRFMTTTTTTTTTTEEENQDNNCQQQQQSLPINNKKIWTIKGPTTESDIRYAIKSLRIARELVGKIEEEGCISFDVSMTKWLEDSLEPLNFTEYFTDETRQQPLYIKYESIPGSPFGEDDDTDYRNDNFCVKFVTEDPGSLWEQMSSSDDNDK
ncbi:uncharacterized protein LOC128954498 [Oppia nitens]|uniref:uncharacterized protein LOC128954498 n=1 Tax=Oppia nitens TaxID=1686743 RepID=UPI0023DAF02C|nr:uncharacterized protein LOC128954498 [Oppia nitens]